LILQSFCFLIHRSTRALMFRAKMTAGDLASFYQLQKCLWPLFHGPRASRLILVTCCRYKGHERAKFRAANYVSVLSTGICMSQPYAIGTSDCVWHLEHRNWMASPRTP
jgi:hypothetical protein